VTLDEIREAVEKNFGVITFVTVPEADEYRQSLAMQEDYAKRQKKWFVSRDGKSKEGPFTFDKLKELVDSRAFEPTAMALAEAEKQSGRGSIPAKSSPVLFLASVRYMQAK